MKWFFWLVFFVVHSFCRLKKPTKRMMDCVFFAIRVWGFGGKKEKVKA